MHPTRGVSSSELWKFSVLTPPTHPKIATCVLLSFSELSVYTNSHMGKGSLGEIGGCNGTKSIAEVFGRGVGLGRADQSWSCSVEVQGWEGLPMRTHPDPFGCRNSRAFHHAEFWVDFQQQPNNNEN